VLGVGLTVEFSMLHITGYIEFITDVCTETFEDSCTDRMLFMIISHDMKAIDSV